MKLTVKILSIIFVTMMSTAAMSQTIFTILGESLDGNWKMEAIYTSPLIPHNQYTEKCHHSEICSGDPYDGTFECEPCREPYKVLTAKFWDVVVNVRFFYMGKETYRTDRSVYLYHLIGENIVNYSFGESWSKKNDILHGFWVKEKEGVLGLSNPDSSSIRILGGVFKGVIHLGNKKDGYKEIPASFHVK